MTEADPLAAALAGIRERHEGAETYALGSAEDVPRLLAAVEAALKLASGWADGPIDATSALTEDRDWVRADCGEGLRQAITLALTGEEKPGG